MRKHNRKMADRFGRTPGDRSNMAAQLGHQITNDKAFQFGVNLKLRALLKRGGL